MKLSVSVDLFVCREGVTIIEYSK